VTAAHRLDAGSLPRSRLVVWAAVLVVGLRALHALGGGGLAVPLGSVDAFADWLDHTPPAVMTMALVRTAGLAAGWYLAACTAVAVLARGLGWARPTALVARVSPAFVRRIVSGGGGLGLAAGALLGSTPLVALDGATPAAAAEAPSPPGSTATMTRLDASGPSAPGTRSRSPDVDPATATMRRLPAEAPPVTPATSTTTAPPVTSTMSTTQAPKPPQPATGAIDRDAIWIVGPGDSFWSIAVEQLTTAQRPDPDERDVTRYWRRLIDANRTGLIDPANPDLLVPGQRLVLPDPG
jgi:hypothetical protein